jgi:hypothetical protein
MSISPHSMYNFKFISPYSNYQMPPNLTAMLTRFLVGPSLLRRINSLNSSRHMPSYSSSTFGQVPLSKNHIGTSRRANGQSFSSGRRKMAPPRLAHFTRSTSFKRLATPARRTSLHISQASPTSKVIDFAIRPNSLAPTWTERERRL